jgi:hypothetical protein
MLSQEEPDPENQHPEEDVMQLILQKEGGIMHCPK